MTILRNIILLFSAGVLINTHAADKLVLDLDADSDLLSLVHNIDDFLFKPTMNFSGNVAGNLAEKFRVEALQDHLVVSALVRIDGEIAGIATEQETVMPDPQTGQPVAESAWLITLNHPKARGVLAVKQRENAGRTFGLVSQVLQAPEKNWQNRFQRFLSTDGETRVQMAVGGLAPYQGGRFEEYNYVNPADLRRFGRFRAKIQFVIYPAE